MPSTGYPDWSPTELLAHRQEAGYTQEQVAAELADISTRHNFDPPLHPSDRMVRKHENGAARPGRRYRRGYTLLYTPEHGADTPAPTRLSASRAVAPASEAAPATPHATRGVISPERGAAPTAEQSPPGDAGTRASGGAAMSLSAFGGARNNDRIVLGGETSSSRRLWPPRHEEKPTNRRDLARLASLAFGATPGGVPEHTSADRLAALEWTTAGGGAVTTAEAVLRAIIADYLSQPPRVILGRVAAFQQLTDGIEQEYILRPADITRLWRLAGIAAGMRGWLENNAGDTDAARVSLREAHRRGELIEDRQVTAWIRFMQATVEDFTGNIDAAECYALDGLMQTTGGSPQRALILGSAIAGVRAAKGDHNGAEKALAQAHDIVAALPPEQHGSDIGRMIVDAMATYSPTGFAADAGNAYARLGQPDRLAEVTVGVRRAADRAETPYRVSFRMNEAIAVLRSTDPDPDRAADLARQALAFGSPFQAAYLANRLGAVLKAAKPFKTHRAIRDLIDYGAAWRAGRFVHAADGI